MLKGNKVPKTIDEYIKPFPKDIQAILKKIRQTIRKAAPKAIERISYGMPFYEYGGSGYKGRLIYFAAFKKHISIFIPPSLSGGSAHGLRRYHTVKATYQFPLDEPFPFMLIGKAVRELVKKRGEEVKPK